MADAIPPLDVDLHENGGRFTVRSVKEIEAWIEKERQAWAWVGKHPEDPNTTTVHKALQHEWNQIDSRMETLRTSHPGETGRLQSAAAQVKAALEEAYHQYRLVRSESDRGRFIATVAKKEEVEAAYTLGYFIGVKHDAPVQYYKGIADALFYETGFEGRTREVVSEAKTSVAALIEETRKKLGSLEKSYREELAFRAPADFWARKQGRHESAVTKFTWIVAASFLTGTAFVAILTAVLLREDKPPLWHVALIAIGGTLVIWVTRLFVRLLMSHVHLASDASERVVMMKAYLALVDERRAFRRTDRHIILQALFRPAATGVVREEAPSGPQTPTELIAQVITGKTDH